MDTFRHRLPRRALIRGAVAAAVPAAATATTAWAGATSQRAIAQVQVGEDAGLPGIGLPWRDWVDRYGEGETLDDAGEFRAYATPDGGTTYVGIADGLIAFIEFAWEGTAAGGADAGDAEAQAGAVLPDDADPAGAWAVGGGADLSAVTFRYERYVSDALADASGLDAVLVVHQEQTLFPDGGDPRTVTLRASLALAAAEAGAESGGGDPGDPGGLGLSLPDYEAVWGAGTAGQAYHLIEAALPDGGDIALGVSRGSRSVSFIRMTWGVDALSDGATSVAVGRDLVLGSLPADATRTASFSLLPTPGGPIQLLVEHWLSDTLADSLGGDGSALTVTWLRPEGSQVVVPRIDMVAADDR